ncbi:hypothetical protein CJ739_3000 [Mariniflexile rhizosphaerae]|nr:hypothetical protein CJ739_3000 [Mariniflexile sp. TRM1-10]PLB20297.1 MAG: hypothetical protein TRG1_946 [Flavobacteriaceae bacterium FS1-H7996/R]
MKPLSNKIDFKIFWSLISYKLIKRKLLPIQIEYALIIPKE